MFELDNVHARYGKVPVLHGVSLKIAPGEAVGLLGRNGVGKTTTLKTIMGLVPASKGTITFGKTRLNAIKAHKIPVKGIGYVPQGRGIFPNLSVKENLLIGLRKAPDPERLSYVFNRFRVLEERLSQPGSTLSGGEQQQLAIARCLILQPRLILFDEPTEGIMPVLVQKIRREIKAINETGVSILLVEQNIKTALKLCSRILIMEKGRIVHDAPAEELREDPETMQHHLGASL